MLHNTSGGAEPMRLSQDLMSCRKEPIEMGRVSVRRAHIFPSRPSRETLRATTNGSFGSRDPTHLPVAPPLKKTLLCAERFS